MSHFQKHTSWLLLITSDVLDNSFKISDKGNALLWSQRDMTAQLKCSCYNIQYCDNQCRIFTSEFADLF